MKFPIFHKFNQFTLWILESTIRFTHYLLIQNFLKFIFLLKKYSKKSRYHHFYFFLQNKIIPNHHNFINISDSIQKNSNVQSILLIDKLRNSACWRNILLLLLIISVFLICSPPKYWPPWYLKEKGIASFYFQEFAFKKTASGTLYFPWEHTAAHKSLPFGTTVLVVNTQNQKRTIVTINDRGPFKTGRIIDLSPAAAADLDIPHKGVVPVEIFTRTK